MSYLDHAAKQLRALIQHEPCELRQSQVSSALNRLDCAIGRLQNNVDALDNRIASVVRNEPPCNPVDGCTVSEKVPMADSLDDLAERVEQVSDFLSGLIERIEL